MQIMIYIINILNIFAKSNIDGNKKPKISKINLLENQIKVNNKELKR